MEVKYFDDALVNSALTSPTTAEGAEHDPPTSNCLNAVTQGDGQSNRDGRKYQIKNTFVSGNINVAPLVNQTAVPPATMCYVALVLDKQTNSAQLSSESVFTNISENAICAANMMREMEFTSRFQVLDAVQIKFDATNVAYDGTNMETGGAIVPFKLSSSKLIEVLSTTGGGGGVGSIVDNSLHIIAYCNSTTLVPKISYNSRIRFVG